MIKDYKVTSVSKFPALIIVLVDFKFKNFDYERFEIDYLKKYSEVVILDLSRLSSKSYFQSISTVEYVGNNIRPVLSYRQLVKEFIFLKDSKYKFNTVIMNFIKPTSFVSLFFLIIIKILTMQSVSYFNSGFPNISSFNNKITIKYLLKGMKRRFFYLVAGILRLGPTHYLYAGVYWRHICGPKASKSKSALLSGHTWDYSNYLSTRRNTNKNELSPHKLAVVLDGAGPMFNSDDINIGKETFMTNEIWYPSLVNFLGNIENISGVNIIIAGHPKSLHKKNPDYFGHRSVFYGKTLEIINESDFVITRGSTAISYAVILKKPIIFIYSDELVKDKLYMASVTKMAELIGTKPVNINDENLHLNDLLVINKENYKSYIDNFLTSGDGERTNAQILLEDVLYIET